MNKYIKEYLLQHQKVQVNNLGLFEIAYKSAEIHPVLHTVSVPGKYVVFSENSIANATEFLHFIALKEHITLDKADERIAEWVKNVKDTINQKKEYPLDTLGKFFINAMGKIEFTPCLDEDISPESFGLEEFTMSVKSLPKSNQQETVDSSQEFVAIYPETEDNVVKKPKRRRDILLVFLFLALGIVLAAGIICYLYPEEVKTYTQKLPLFNKEQTQRADENQPASTSNNAEETSQIEQTQQIDLQKDTIQKEVSKPEQAAKMEATVQTGDCYVVIGSFRSEKNAENFIQKYQKEYPTIVNLGKGQTSGLYMIGIGPYIRAEAESQVKGGKSGWWILKK